jgi:hypothetical protein
MVDKDFTGQPISWRIAARDLKNVPGGSYLSQVH